MEIVHSMVGFVRSPVFTTFLQGATFLSSMLLSSLVTVFSRVWVLWAVMYVAPPAQTHFFTVLCITSWACVEVPRYLFYALNLLGEVPYPIFWLRYRYNYLWIDNCVLYLQFICDSVPHWHHRWVGLHLPSGEIFVWDESLYVCSNCLCASSANISTDVLGSRCSHLHSWYDS